MARALLALSLAGVLSLLGAAPAAAQEISGPATAVDGDTLAMGDTRIRLFGIDAPELAQTCDRQGEAWRCGEAARDELAKLVAGAPITCQGRASDAYGRLVATCRVGRVDLAEALAGAGWATAYTQYGDDYLEREALAKRFKLGIWGATFDSPAAWRAAHPEPAPRVASAAGGAAAPARPRAYRDRTGGCLIKGNHSRKGEWIYHLPGQAYYDQTRPEALFCTEAEALRAGYRPSKV